MKIKMSMTDDISINKSVPVMNISEDVLIGIIETVGRFKAETGGVLGGKINSGLVSHFHFDKTSRNSSATYSPDYRSINQLLNDSWNPKDIRLHGFVHSHPGELYKPSKGDEIYAERILQVNEELECLWLPIVNTVADTGTLRIVPWAVYPDKRGVNVVRGRINVIETDHKIRSKFYGLQLPTNETVDEITLGRDILHAISAKPSIAHERIAPLPISHANDLLLQVSQHSRHQKPELGKTFDRVTDAYDLEVLRNSRIITIGAGGAASWIEELARAGVGQFVLIDHDIVSETNLATQQVYRRDIQRAKVECLEERIIDINPTAGVLALQKNLFDIGDKEFELICTGSIDGKTPRQSIVCGLTDNFFAQARINRLALKLGLPSLCAQVYKEGRGAEITFNYPGVTPACHRCILSSRYRYFLNEKKESQVTSQGTPIFATSRLNSLKGFITLAMLHHGTTHPRWGRMLERIGKRNLVQLRMDPDFSETLGMDVFDRVFEQADKSRLFFDEVVWLPQDQECPDTGYAHCCPDCGGTGDLRNAIGKFTNTKESLTDVKENHEADFETLSK